MGALTQGSGTTNNGNTARSFFENVDIVSRATGKKKLRTPAHLYDYRILVAFRSSTLNGQNF